MFSLELSSDFADDIGAHAVQRLLEVCRHEGGGTRPIADFLVSLHNSSYATVDAYQLCRRLDDEHFLDVVTVLRWFRDAPYRCDLQDIFVDGPRIMADLMERFDLNRHRG
ncbi:DUF7673 family protein [Paraburkholderia lycopersici]|uniref:DUF7673 family protein n=1 Tax=Paraburkholderia lycopersici TaxID=416944 RepID=UPI000B835916|nr:hypothetical protein [Paraburkholderia lycopersici]